ncbi:Gfo/Idh/MocA family protein [Streptomyces sp. NRRL S-340]|uniref:Gfo/Idh/MocA family protein n=1 Tax=Streptomyces sp. NRRL S-340 TaxID=1463901 RepID=UPI00056980F3|nr:Gfo/Idh/MocA family oxidoreductase [Streptomyces sp. NRRL S-340]
MSTRKQTCLVIGAGPRGTMLARAVAGHPDVSLVGVVEPSPVAAAAFRTEFPQVPVHTEMAEALSTVTADFAVVATPPQRHARDAVAVLDHGFAVLVECPMVESRDQAEAVAEAAARSGRPAAMAESFCYLPAVQSMKRLIGLKPGPEGGSPLVLGGEGHYLEWDTGLAPGGWRDDYAMARYITHGLGPLLYATGQRARRVIALDPLGRASRAQGALMPSALVETDRGAVFFTANSGLAPRPLTRWTIVAEDWAVESDPEGTWEGPLRVFDGAGGEHARAGWRSEPVDPATVYDDLWGMGFEPERLMLRRFAREVAYGQPDVGLELSLNISLAGVAAERSGRGRGTPVDIGPVVPAVGP